MDHIASVMLRLAEYEPRSLDGSQPPKQSPALWKSTRCASIKVEATLGWLQGYVRGESAEAATSQMEYHEKLWRLLDVMLTRHLRDVT